MLVRAIREEDWSEYRAIRLEMLRDTPMAYGETYGDAVTRDEADWRRRASATSSVPSVRFAAIADDGNWIGSMGCFVEDGTPTLVGVYVAPAHRGDAFGVTSALMMAVEEWATPYGDRIRLDVHESNARAIAAYTKRGYTLTGRTHPYPPDPTHQELEMTKPLRPLSVENSGVS